MHTRAACVGRQIGHITDIPGFSRIALSISHGKASMTPGQPCSPVTFPAAVPPGYHDLLLPLLDARSVAWDEVALTASEMPGLIQAVLRASPTTEDPRLAAGLVSILRVRLETLGTDLLKTWLLSTTENPDEADALRRAHRRARLVAALAVELADRQHYPHHDEAWLSGLWHALERILPAPGMTDDKSDATERVIARRLSLAQGCGLSPALLDALAAIHTDVETIGQSHPLSAIVWTATRLARSGDDDDLLPLARQSGLTPVELQAMHQAARTRTRETRTSSLNAPSDNAGGNPIAHQAHLLAPSRSDTLARAWQGAAQRGLIQAGFAQPADDDALRARFLLASELLCGVRPALLLVPEHDSRHMTALALTGNAGLESMFAELGLRIDDARSRIALAMRSGTPTSSQEEGLRPQRCAADWHLVRWLQSPFVSIPFETDGSPGFGVALIACSPGSFIDEARQNMLAALATAATRNHLARAERQRLARDLEAEQARRYREHARRIAHEAGSPLSVIGNYLELFAQRQAPDSSRPEELRVVREELERIRRLIASVSETPQVRPESALCHVAELLHDIRALYGESLFGARDIHFELRTGDATPPAAIPPSALRQVLLNLLRNASETLHPGGRCTVALAGQLIVDGRPCVEIRVMDNGPGLPPERMADIFGPQPSHKGGEHQGLGLAISREILAQWQATILCRSQGGVGTSFQLLVPIAESS